jgi:hypothetical protein
MGSINGGEVSFGGESGLGLHCAVGGEHDRADHNQIANYVLAETPVNIRIGKLAPAEYGARVRAQIEAGSPDLGDITTEDELLANLRSSAVPESLLDATAAEYPAFLIQRRKQMAALLRDYYFSL